MALPKTLKLEPNTKPLKWEITNKPTLYRDDDYIISFRLIVLHAIRGYLKKTPFEPKSVKTLLTELKNAALSISPNYYERHFMELYAFDKNMTKGLILIDHTLGSFALVLYPNDSNPAHGMRINGLIKSIDDLMKHHEKYEALLSSNQKWDVDLVNELRALFTSVKKKNDSVF